MDRRVISQGSHQSTAQSSRTQEIYRRGVLNKLPNETSRRLVAYVGNHGLAALCLVSKAAHKFFSPLLYRREPNPTKIAKYLYSLAKPNRTGFGAHPATYACHLDLQVSFLADHTNGIDLQKKNEEKIQQYGKLVLAAIENTARVSAGRSKLQTLRWTSNVAIEDIGPMLLKRDRFPNLETIAICSLPSYGSTRKRANFQVRSNIIFHCCCL